MERFPLRDETPPALRMAVPNVVGIRDGEPVGVLMSLPLDGVPCLAVPPAAGVPVRRTPTSCSSTTNLPLQ